MFLNLYRGITRIFQRGNQTESNRGYTPDCHVDLRVVFDLCDKKRLTSLPFYQNVLTPVFMLPLQKSVKGILGSAFFIMIRVLVLAH